MIGVLAMALAATSNGAADEATTAARRCDTPAYEAAVGRIEDEALAAMKAANEAVARAARAGAVGTAGDAEWNDYKARMALAEQVRMANVPILATCQAGPGAAPVAHAEPASPPPPVGERLSGEPRFRIGVSDGAADYDIRSATSIPVVSQSGLYQVVSPSPTGSVTFPGGTFSPATTTPAGAVRLKTDAWENQVRVNSSFASDGFDRPGWRLSAAIGLDTGTIHEHLAGPLVASAPNIDLAAPPQVTCVLVSAFTGECFEFGLAVPYTGQAFQLAGQFNSPFQSEVKSYDVRQSDRRFLVEGGAARVFAVPSPVGDLDLTVGADFGGRWWSFDQTRTIDAVAQGQTADFVASFHNRGDGPGFSAKAKLALSGAIWRAWPLRWTLFGDYGAEWAELTIHADQGGSAVLNRTRPVSDFGGEIEYDLSRAVSIAVIVQQQRTPYVSSVLSAGIGPGAGINDGSGTFFDLLDTNVRIYSLLIQYGF